MQNDKIKQVSRRDMLLYGASLAAVSALGGTGVSAVAQMGKELARTSPQTPKPNILFILMDEDRRRVLGEPEKVSADCTRHPRPIHATTYAITTERLRNR